MNLCLDFIRSTGKFSGDQGISLMFGKKERKRSPQTVHIDLTGPGPCPRHRTTPPRAGEPGSVHVSRPANPRPCMVNMSASPSRKDWLSWLGCSPGAAPLGRPLQPRGCCSAGRLPLLGSLLWVTIGTEILAPQVLVPRPFSSASQQISF